MILPALSLLLHASVIDSSQRMAATLLDSIQKSGVCKEVVPVSPSNLPTTLDRAGDARIRTVACPNGLRRTMVRWEGENRTYDRDLYLEDFHGMLFVHSSQFLSSKDEPDDSLVEHWIYRTPGGSLAYSSTGSARTVRTTRFDTGLANTADRIFWEEGRYRALSDSQAKTIGLRRGFAIAPHRNCERTTFPLSAIRQTWNLLARDLNLRLDSASLLTWDELRCQDMSSFAVAQADFPHHRTQLTIGRRWDSLEFVLHRSRSRDLETERILVPNASRNRTWWRASERLDAVHPDFVPDSTSPSAKGLLAILDRMPRFPNDRSIDSLREDSVKQEVIRRQVAIDQAIRQRRCEEIPADPLPALERLANKSLGEPKARLFLCPSGIGSRFVQRYDSTETPFEIRLDATEAGLLALGMGKPEKPTSRLAMNWFSWQNSIRSQEIHEAPADPRGAERGGDVLEHTTWSQIESSFLQAFPDFPNQAIAVDGFLLLEASPEIASNRPIRRRGDWNVQEVDAASIPDRWSRYRKRTLRTWGGDPRRLDTIVGFCLISAASPAGDDEESPIEPSSTYLAAKLSKNKTPDPPRLLGLSTLLPDKIEPSPGLGERFSTWTGVLEERAKESVAYRFRQGSSSSGESSVPEGNTPEFGLSTWTIVDSLASYFFTNRTQGRPNPCEDRFDASYSIAALETPGHRETPFRDVFAPPEPARPTLAESESFAAESEPGMQEIAHPCDDLAAFECGIHELSKAKPGRRLQALVESRGEKHLLQIREWDGSRWITQLEIDRPEPEPGSYGGCD